MAKKKDNLKNLSIGELHKELRTFEEDLRSMRFKAEGSKSKNVKESLMLRRDIARILTFINQKENVTTKKSKILDFDKSKSGQNK
ncbi:MAG TPA: 50S ribosomal protein L29 [Candidatus Paceibacterota bacterium]